MLFPYPFITKYSVTANYMLSPTTFLEGTYGFIRNELTGGNENGILMNESANRLNGLAAFPLLYPDAGIVPKDSYAFEVLEDVKPPFWDGTRMNLPPTFSWGGRIGAAPPNQRYPGWLNINRTQDVAISVTKIAGRHSLKAGFYNNHSFKAQNIGGTAFQGAVEFDNDTQQRARYPVRLRERRGGRLPPLHAGLEVRRGQHALQQHRGLHPGQLEGEQPSDARRWASASRASSRSTTSSSRCRTSSRSSGRPARRRSSTSPAAPTARSSAPATPGTR